MFKRGALSTIQDLFIGLVFAALVIFIFVFISNNFLELFNQDKGSCDNKLQWNGVKDLVKNLDKGEVKSMIFINEKCNLVSFSFSLGLQNHPIQPDFEVAKDPQLCMCKVDGENCKHYKCYKLTDVTAIVDENDKPFTTSELQPYTYLTFTKLNNKLVVQTIGNFKSPEPITGALDVKEFNENNILNKLTILFNTRSIKSFIPIINIKSDSLFIPEGIPKDHNLPYLFDIDLGLPSKESLGNLQYLSNHESIDTNFVVQADIELSIPKNILENIDSSNIALYYKNFDSWKSSRLSCETLENFYLCKSNIKGFSKEFAISVPSVRVSFISNSELEVQLTPLINGLSFKYNVDPLLVKAIIQKESAWNEKAISKTCGAGGLMQLMPGTAQELGLLTFENSNIIKCDPDYASRLFSFVNSNTDSAKLDNRFNFELNIDAGIRYISKITNQLKLNNIEPSVENIAASYNAGPNRIIKDSGVPNIPETKDYVVAVIQNYNKLVSSSYDLTGDKVWPINNPIITSCYGSRVSPLTGDLDKLDWHDGIDFGIPIGTPVYSVADGVVISVHNCDPDCTKGGGNSLLIKHNDGFTGYLHLSEILVENNAKVTKGQVIAKSGNTGRSTGPHLHFNVYINPDFSTDVGKPNYERDPLNYLPKLSEYKVKAGARNCLESPSFIALKQQDVNIVMV